MSTVSVVIPTHNRAELLCRAIQSVLDQTFQAFEIIVVDDASGDDTEAAVRGFHDRRIQYIRHAVGKGDAGARNTGVRNAEGDYVAFLDDDDEWLPEKLRMQMDFCEANGPDLAGVHTARWTINTATGSRSILSVNGRGPHDLQANWITTSSMCLRRRCFETVGFFDERIPFCSDYDMWIRVAQRFRLGYIQEPLVKYHVHGDGLSGDLAKRIRGQELLLAKHGSFFSTSVTGNSRKYLSLGILYGYAGDVRKARAAFWRASRINPWAIQNYFNLCLSLLGPVAFKKVRAWRDKRGSHL